MNDDRGANDKCDTCGGKVVLVKYWNKELQKRCVSHAECTVCLKNIVATD